MSINSAVFRICVYATLLCYTLISACKMNKTVVPDKICATKYPIVLVHGVALRDDIKVKKYWNTLPNALRKHGALVFLSNHDAFNSYVECALQLRETIFNVLDSTKAEKVNLIAHSKGGIDSRFLISRLNMSDKVASLTTIASPHRGSSLADTIITCLSRKKILGKTARLLNAYAHFFGDKKPDAFTAGYNLTKEYMTNYNNSVLNAQNVYYQSYGSFISEKYPSLVLRLLHDIIAQTEGENDANVSVSSFKWGNFRGIVTNPDQNFGVSHMDIVGIKFISKHSTFNAEHFMIQIVVDLKKRGY